MLLMTLKVSQLIYFAIMIFKDLDSTFRLCRNNIYRMPSVDDPFIHQSIYNVVVGFIIILFFSC